MKDAIKGKGKPSQKQKSIIIEADELEAEKLEIDSELEVVCIAEEIIKGRGKHSRKHKSTVLEVDKLEPEVVRITNVLVPQRALVVQMI